MRFDILIKQFLGLFSGFFYCRDGISCIKDKKLKTFKQTFGCADYDNDIWVNYYSNVIEILFFGKIIKESCMK